MTARKPLGLALAVTALLGGAAAAQQTPAAKAPRQFEILHAEDFQSDLILPPPAARGSQQEQFELAELRKLIADASPERRAQAKWDAEHEDPALFDSAIGLKLEDLPATWALLKLVQHEADTAADGPKVRFGRLRPWGIDPTLPNCDDSKGNPGRSYPSGHATLSYSVGTVLARLMPGKASAIMARAQDYALSREICGVHFPSDTEASHALGSMVSTRLVLDASLQPRLDAARAELARAEAATSAGK